MNRIADLQKAVLTIESLKEKEQPSRDAALENTDCENYGCIYVKGRCLRCGDQV